MKLPREVKKEIEYFVTNTNKSGSFINFINYTLGRSHELIKDKTQAGHTKRKKLKQKMYDYRLKLIQKKLEQKLNNYKKWKTKISLKTDTIIISNSF